MGYFPQTFTGKLQMIDGKYFIDVIETSNVSLDKIIKKEKGSILCEINIPGPGHFENPEDLKLFIGESIKIVGYGYGRIINIINIGLKTSQIDAKRRNNNFKKIE